MRVLVACEYSGRVREAFRKKGHDAWSCDFLPCEDNSPFHYQCDVLELLSLKWDLMICHPPCTYLCSSGLHWNKRVEGRQEKTEEALLFVKQLLSANVPRICLENPVGCISTRIRKANQYIQPYDFNCNAAKRTGLWLKGLPFLKPTGYVQPRWVCCKHLLDEQAICPYCFDDKVALPRWSNQTNSGQNKLAPSEDRWRERSRTYQGFADAFADQWS